MKLNKQQCRLMQNLKNKNMNEAIGQLVNADETRLDVNFYDNFEITPFMVVARCSVNRELDVEENLMHKIAYRNEVK